VDRLIVRLVNPNTPSVMYAVLTYFNWCVVERSVTTRNQRRMDVCEFERVGWLGHTSREVMNVLKLLRVGRPRIYIFVLKSVAIFSIWLK
jgi:hypothetical protein